MHFIGTFNTTDNIIIRNPYPGKVIAEYISMSEHNLKHIEIDSHNGIWYAYHFYGNNRYPVALILFEESYHFKGDIQNILTNSLIEQGKVVSSFEQMISAVDKQAMNNTMYTYINSADDLMYRIKDVRKWLNETNPVKKEKIRQLLDVLENKGENFVKNAALIPLCNIKRIPIESDIWANDCYFRLKNNPINATVILSGIISRTYSDENMVYTDSEKDCRIIYIDLDENASKAPPFRIVK